MAARHIAVDKDSELGRLIEDASEVGDAIVLEVEGHAYRLTPQAPGDYDAWRDYNPQAVRLALIQTAGALTGMDVDELKRQLREERGQRSRGRPA